jgi:hypothetical protein
MIEFTITGEELWARMERALEKVNERLRKTVRILEDAKVPYAVIGDHAVRAWVAQVEGSKVEGSKGHSMFSGG